MRNFTLRRRRTPKERPHIPQRSGELTAAWFTEVLATGATVTEVRHEQIGIDVGFMGEVHRCHLTWDRSGRADADVADLPRSVIVKVPTQVPENFAAGDALRSYEREIVVYQSLRSTLGVPMPGYYFGAMDPDPAPWIQRPIFFLFDHLPIRGINWVISQFLKLSGKSKRRYVLVIEDIADARPPTQQARRIARRRPPVARGARPFHAANWMRADVSESYPYIWPVDTVPRVGQASYVRNRDEFVERFGPVLHDGMLARLDAIQERIPELCTSLAAEPWTLLHGDFRLDNVLFRPNGDMVVLDFQGLGARSARRRRRVLHHHRTHRRAPRGGRTAAAHLPRCARRCGGDRTTRSTTSSATVNSRRSCSPIASSASADVLDTSVAGDGDSLMDLIQFRVLDWLD